MRGAGLVAALGEGGEGGGARSSTGEEGGACSIGEGGGACTNIGEGVRLAAAHVSGTETGKQSDVSVTPKIEPTGC